jgi:hypothetical protein
MRYPRRSFAESIKELDKQYQLGTSLQVFPQNVHLFHGTRYSGLYYAIIPVRLCLSFYQHERLFILFPQT